MSSSPRLAIVGPTHPHQGGIAQHTTELVHRLGSRVHVSELAAWSSQAPAFMSPRRPAAERPESRSFARVSRELDWRRPSSWSRTGSRLARDASVLVMVMTDPFQAPALIALARSFRAERPSGSSHVVLIAHNVLPHQRRPGDVIATRSALRAAERVVVHAPDEARDAARFGARDVVTCPLPFHFLGDFPTDHRGHQSSSIGRRIPKDRLAFFGMVRPHKGVRDLLRALAIADSTPELVILGEFWEPRRRYERLIATLGLDQRVTIHDRYASPAEVDRVLREADAMMLPYRTATGSQMPRVAFAHGLPVIGTDVADFREQVTHGVDGLISAPGDAAGLAASIDEFYRADVWHHLRTRVQVPVVDAEWDRYLAAVLDGLVQ